MYVVRKTGYVIRDGANPKDGTGKMPLQASLPPPDTMAEELCRLERLYLKSDGERQFAQARDNLAEFFREVASRYTAGIQADPQVPDALRQVLREDLLSFNSSMARAAAETAITAAEKSPDVNLALLGMLPVLEHSAVRLSNIIRRHDLAFRSYLELLARTDYSKFLFLSERTEASCFRCESLHGRIFSAGDLSTKNIIPPLHPNCKCSLVAIDSTAEYMYNLDRDGFVRRLDALPETSNGGVFLLSHDFLSLAPDERALRALSLFDYPAVTDGAHSEPRWYDGLRDWAVKFGQDALAFVGAFIERGRALVVRADDMMRDNLLLGLAYWADALTMGILSGLVDVFIANVEVYADEKNLYNYLNALTFGLLDMFEGALFPEEFMSFRHVLDVIGVVTFFLGAAKLVKPTLSGSLDDIAGVADDFIDDAAGTADDFIDDAARAQYYDDILDDIARQEGEIIGVFDADDLNAALAAKGYEPSYIPGTKVYQIELTGNTEFVRLYGGTSDLAGRWIMKADDIAGLTAEQIRDKFSLPQTPTHICDVIPPIGTRTNISIANGILTGSGKSVQYNFVSAYLKDWFTNARALQ